jgi:hypothetical protein
VGAIDHESMLMAGQVNCAFLSPGEFIWGMEKLYATDKQD